MGHDNENDNSNTPLKVSNEEVVISLQPTTMAAVESSILELDASQVKFWSAQDVINNFIERIGCGYANEMFLANKISGKALMMLREGHLKEMGIQAIGDRVLMMEMISVLKRKKTIMENNAVLWNGSTPSGGCVYQKNLLECCVSYVCPCCPIQTEWKVTGQGVFHKDLKLCGTVSTDYMDYRFFKDLELKEEHLCCCFCQRYKLEMYVEGGGRRKDDDDDDEDDLKEGEGLEFTAPRVLYHPEAPNVEKIIRNAWSEARLVGE